MAEQFHHIDSEPDKTTGIDAEYLSGRRYPYQEAYAPSRRTSISSRARRAVTSTGSRTSSC